MLAFGGGANSMACAVLMHKLGMKPQAIVFCDTGSEWPETYAYIESVANPWFERVGFPLVEVARRWIHVNMTLPESLREQCDRLQSVPAIAFGYKRCSQHYKAETSKAYVRQQEWARATWARGERVVKVIGYDAGESRRIRPEFAEDKRYVNWYPLYDRWLEREDCIRLIESEGIPAPRKSACYYCPSNTDRDWLDLRDLHPDLFADALHMEEAAQATIKDPHSFGLRRRGRPGEKQLREWAKGQLGPEVDRDSDELPCECVL